MEGIQVHGRAEGVLAGCRFRGLEVKSVTIKFEGAGHTVIPPRRTFTRFVDLLLPQVARNIVA